MFPAIDVLFQGRWFVFRRWHAGTTAEEGVALFASGDE